MSLADWQCDKPRCMKCVLHLVLPSLVRLHCSWLLYRPLVDWRLGIYLGVGGRGCHLNAAVCVWSLIVLYFYCPLFFTAEYLHTTANAIAVVTVGCIMTNVFRPPRPTGRQVCRKALVNAAVPYFRLILSFLSVCISQQLCKGCPSNVFRMFGHG